MYLSSKFKVVGESCPHHLEPRPLKGVTAQKITVEISRPEFRLYLKYLDISRGSAVIIGWLSFFELVALSFSFSD